MARWLRSLSARGKWWLFGSLFTVDATLVLLPPVYWAAGSPGAQHPVPLSLVYFLGTGLLIVLSVMALYHVERVRGELD